MPVINTAAATLTSPEASRFATTGNLAGCRSPLNEDRVLVASPTATNLTASRIDPPVTAAINPCGVENERCFANPS
jgi:hypothetical protein